MRSPTARSSDQLVATTNSQPDRPLQKSPRPSAWSMTSGVTTQITEHLSPEARIYCDRAHTSNAGTSGQVEGSRRSRRMSTNRLPGGLAARDDKPGFDRTP